MRCTLELTSVVVEKATGVAVSMVLVEGTTSVGLLDAILVWIVSGLKRNEMEQVLEALIGF